MKYLKYIVWVFFLGISSLSVFGVEDWFSQKRAMPSIDQEEGRTRIEAFRNFRYEGDICLNFSLINMPYGREKQVYKGTLWSSRNDQGPITRIELMPSSGYNQQPIRLLIQNGFKRNRFGEDTNPKIWYLGNGSQVYPLPEQDWMKPLLNTLYTPFELSLGFLFWPQFTYEGPKRVKGRVAQLFVMLPPVDFAKANPNVGGVHIAMDMEYNFLLQADILNRVGAPMKSIKLNSFKKVQEEYIIKELDIVDNVTKDKTRFVVDSAALCLAIDRKSIEPSDNYSYFTPENLARDNPRIDSKYFSFLH